MMLTSDINGCIIAALTMMNNDSEIKLKLIKGSLMKCSSIYIILTPDFYRLSRQVWRFGPTAETVAVLRVFRKFESIEGLEIENMHSNKHHSHCLNNK